MDDNIKIINLSAPNKQPIMIKETRFISIGKELYGNPSGFLKCVKKFLNKHEHIEKTVFLDIQDVKVDSNLVVKDKKALFTILHDIDKTEQKEFPVKFELSRLKEPFTLLFNPEQISDCTKSQHSDKPDEFSISYRLILKDDKGTVINKKDSNGAEGELETITFQFTRETNEPRLKILVDDAALPLDYKSGLGICKIGSLAVQLPNPLLYAPSVDLKIDFKIIDEDRNEVKNFLIVRKNGKTIDNVSEANLRTKIRDNGKVAPTCRYDLYLNVDAIVNPMEDVAKYTIVASPRYKYSYESTFKPISDLTQSFDVNKDKQGTELVVSVEHDGKTLKLEDGGWQVPKINFTASSLTYPIKFILKNKATDTSRSGAGLTVSNLHIRSTMPEGFALYDKYQNQLSVSRVIGLRGQVPNLEEGTGLFIPNGRDNASSTSFYINFTPENVYTIRKDGRKVYDFSINTYVEFDYTEDSNGNGNCERKHFRGLICWNLYKRPNPEWLCIDYGSSAIVCYYGKGSDSDAIDLRDARQKVYAMAKQDPRTNPQGFKNDQVDDKIEHNTRFLPSDILLHDVKGADKTGLCSQLDVNSDVRYNNMAVLLSPTEKLSVENFRRQLPCLKVLMGNKFLPDNDHYKAFSYSYLDNGVVKTDTAERLKDSEYSLLQIDNIFKETYHTLFHYFIQDESIIEQANKLVLTYPNTYTPRNLMTLKSIVNNTLPGVREVQFVSESDAVAAYYMAHWNDYHADTENIKADENILVYDMGAGTLDVTYLTKRYDAKTGKFTLEICGKIGTGRAGNYFDSVIAQILYNKLREDNFKKSWINTDMKGVEEDVLSARVELKAQIKNKIKPGLSSNKKIDFEIANHKFHIDPGAILEDDLFKQLLDQVTTNIWLNLKKYVGESHFRVDTIIMSGRSLRLKVLQDRIQSLAKNDKAKCIMLDNVTNGKDKGTNNDRSKTAVVEGAKTFVETYRSEDSPVVIRSRRLQASYGVAFKRTGGAWEYKELLSMRDIPFSDSRCDEFGRRNGPLLVEHTNESNVLLFIQTYMSEEDTRLALNSGNEEYVSVMSEVMMADLDNKASLKLDVTVDRNNNVSLYADGLETQYKAPAGVDLKDEVTKRSLWPVSISNE